MDYPLCGTCSLFDCFLSCSLARVLPADRSVISRHIKHVFAEGKLEEKAMCKKCTFLIQTSLLRFFSWMSAAVSNPSVVFSSVNGNRVQKMQDYLHSIYLLEKNVCTPRQPCWNNLQAARHASKGKAGVFVMKPGLNLRYSGCPVVP